MKSNNVYEYQKALKQRVRMYEEFVEKHNKVPTDKQICVIPTPPDDLVNAFKQGTLVYGTLKCQYQIREMYAVHARRVKQEKTKERLREHERSMRLASFATNAANSTHELKIKGR